MCKQHCDTHKKAVDSKRYMLHVFISVSFTGQIKKLSVVGMNFSVFLYEIVSEADGIFFTLDITS